jgi:hypothetical protein
MTKIILKAAVALTAITSSSAIFGETTSSIRPELRYFLPRTRVVANVQQIIRRCPTPEQPLPLVTTKLGMDSELGPDPHGFIHVDARSGLLSGRTTKLELRPDGTLTSFNATSTGEGGDVLSALITVGATIASFGVGLPIPLVAPAPGFHANVQLPEPPLHCIAEIERLVNRMAQVELDLANLRSRLAAGQESAASAAVLDALTTELSGLIGQLTLGSAAPAKFDPGPGDFQAHEEGAAAPSAMIRYLPPIDFSHWFRERDTLADGLRRSEVAGLNGFRASLTPNRELLDLLAVGDGSRDPRADPTPYLYYRRPVPATLAVRACGAAWTGSDCAEAESGPDADIGDSKRILLPQLSGLFSIPIGNGNIFGTRQASATFDEQGAPTTLEYGSTSGGTAIAGVINGVGTGATTLHNAQSAAVASRLADEKARRELQTLFNTPFPAPTPAVPTAPPAAGGD